MTDPDTQQHEINAVGLAFEENPGEFRQIYFYDDEMAHPEDQHLQEEIFHHKYEACILSEAQSLVREFSATRRYSGNISWKIKQFGTIFIKYIFFYVKVDFYDFFQMKISTEEMRSNHCYEKAIK